MIPLRGRWWTLVAYLGVVALVTGGLAWVTREALRLEQSDTLRLALWRLDSRVFPLIAREDSRPVAQYDPLYPPMPALNRNGQAVEAGSILVPSPLLDAELPPWMALHFSVDSVAGWRSPQVLDERLLVQLRRSSLGVAMLNADEGRRRLLAELQAQFPAPALIGVGTQQLVLQRQQAEQVQDAETVGQVAATQQQSAQADYGRRSSQQKAMLQENRGVAGASNSYFNYRPESGVYFAEKGQEWSSKGYACVSVTLEPMVPRWLKGADGIQRLMLLRPLEAKRIKAVQGVLLDWPKLRAMLLDEVRDLLPSADLQPAEADGGISMTALPVKLVTPAPVWQWPGWHTPMRAGLSIAWCSAILALAFVGLGGWSLLDFSERRFRFVTAVTHELRTPLTTLRLYTDMLTSGMVRQEKQREEYLGTLNTEAERLHRLIGNVLDYARLERQTPNISRQPTSVAGLLDGVASDWQARCQSTGKQLIVERAQECPETLTTDGALVRQILGNLVDNACKYSAEAKDARIWLRARQELGAVVFEVEDRGPGLAGRESRSVFRPFVRGREAPATAGGVGLGLALAARWAKLLGGSLGLASCPQGACFRLTLPKG